MQEQGQTQLLSLLPFLLSQLLKQEEDAKQGQAQLLFLLPSLRGLPLC